MGVQFLIIFGAMDPSKKMCTKKHFWKPWYFFFIKNHLPIQFVENIWIKHLVMQLCYCVFSLPKKPLVKKHYQT
jgi:hypothetical protein